MSDSMAMTASIIIAVVMATALAASLINRRLPLARTVQMAGAWLLIFALVYGVSLFRDDLAAVWQRARDDVTGTRTALVSGAETVVRRDDDGHYRITGSINNQPLTFLIDTGAGVTVIDPTVADRIGLSRDQQQLPQRLMTAGGQVTAYVALPVTLQVGNIRRTNFVPWIGGHADEVNVLGVDWLNALTSWRVEGGELHLVP